MKASRGVVWLAAVLLLTACSRQPKSAAYAVDVLLPMTPVKDQGRSELCWAYAMLATIETEHLVRGDSVNLSAVYVGRMLDDYRAALSAQTAAPATATASSQRAMGQTLLNIIGRYGIVPYDVLPDDATPDLPTPRLVFMLGARYTPQEFAHSVCAPGEYVGLTCVADSPYYEKVVVPVPDNWERNRLLNVPLDTLRLHTDRALRHRHPVCWESSRHAMAVVGLARDRQTNAPFYVLKNSWGAGNADGGLVYMAADELWRNMKAIYMTQEAYNYED